ncbi:MAG: flagellar filament capping protein FliD [Planctomycetota bacterium]
MSGPIQFGGLASGLDTGAIIDALVQAESVPINLLKQQKADAQNQISLLGTFQGYVDALKTKMASFAGDLGFLANSVEVSQEGFFQVDANGGAQNGSYTLEVNSVASSDRFALSSSAKITDPAADLGDVSVAFDYDGQSYDVALTAGSASLNDLAAAIEDQTDGAIQAKVINTGTSGSPNYQLVIEGTDTGEDFAVQNLTITNPSGVLDTQSHLTTASNAEIVLNGLTIQRSTNAFHDVVDGLEIDVQAETSGPVTFDVGLDEDAVVSKLQDFVKAYNDVVNFVNGQSEFSEDSGPSGALFGDSSLRTVKNGLASTLFSSQLVDATSAFGSLGLVGIKLAADGTLSVDETKVKEKLALDADAFRDFFVDLDGFDNGGAAEGTGEYYVDTTSDTGLFALLQKKLEALIDDKPLPSGAKAPGIRCERRSPSVSALLGRPEHHRQCMFTSNMLRRLICRLRATYPRHNPSLELARHLSLAAALLDQCFEAWGTAALSSQRD